MFIPVAKNLIKTNEWKWVKAFSQFLIKAEDEYTIELLKRYSKENFILMNLLIIRIVVIQKKKFEILARIY